MNIACSICTSHLGETDELRVTSCGHLYHDDCIGQWLERRHNCPECRVRCTPESLVRLYLNVDRKPKAPAKVVSKSAVDVCPHRFFSRMWCLEHRHCKNDCRSPMYGIHLTDFFHNNNINGCLYCRDCTLIPCEHCKKRLDTTIVRYKRKLYHEHCFPCLRCNLTLVYDAPVLQRPSRRYHDECLRCEWCNKGLVGTLYDFIADLPICQDCMRWKRATR